MLSKKIPKKFEGRFAFVNVAAARARQIQNGAKPKIKADSGNAAQIAMKEALANLIEWDFLVEDAAVPQSKPKLGCAVNC